MLYIISSAKKEKCEKLKKQTYIVAHEEVIGVRGIAADPEELD